ncbi:hypothetical protein Nepgr_016054 [Nepenthes gracilis]|uniref:Uncharacterized protein n=1 Tax=Nepenthes gracilis TaxID=150966 RepID=A0AAD3SMT6_NEPGR|nr:hypothetical protein Nepgr_016054 [Nepenthes gracilis]
MFLLGLAGVDLNPQGQSRLRRKICRTAVMRSTVGSPGGGQEDRNFLQTFRWRAKASSVPISLSDRATSSSTASAQRPQIHMPMCLSRILSTYAGVHSSVNPQQSHLANSISAFAEEMIWPADEDAED